STVFTETVFVGALESRKTTVLTLRPSVTSLRDLGGEGWTRLRSPCAVPPACRATPSAAPATSRASLPALSITLLAFATGGRLLAGREKGSHPAFPRQIR